MIGRRASNREITERKNLLEEISRLNSLNQSILNASSLGIAVYEYLGKCIYINKVAADTIGATIEQGLKQNFRFIESWRKTGLLDYALKALDSNSIHKFEVKTTSTFGKDVWLACSLIPFISNNEKYLMIVFDDISIRKNMELQLIKSHDELELKVEERTKELDNLNKLLNEELRKKIKIGKETIKEKEFLNSLIDTAGSIVLVLDKNANIILFNKYAEKITGYSKKEVIGKNWFELFIPGNEAYTIKNVFEDVLKNLPDYSNYENKILTKDGRELLINWSNTIVKNEKGEPTGTLSIGINVTEQKELELTYKNIYNTMNEGMALHELIYDSVGNPIDYILIDVNPAFEKITTLKKDSIVGHKATEIYKTKEAPYLEIYSDVVKTSNPTKFEIFFVPMGKYFSVSAFSPRANKFVTIFEDITERKRSEEKLKEAIKIINSSNKILFTWKNTEGWPVEYVSENVLNIMGYAPEDLISGKIKYADCIHSEDLPRVIQEVIEFSTDKDKTEFLHKPYRILTNKSEIKYVSDWTSIVRDAEGSILYYKGIVEDITDKLKTEQALKESENTLKSLFNSAPVGICLLKDRVFQWLNPKLAEIFGYEEKELIGKGTKILYSSEEEYERVGKVLYPKEFNNPFSQIEAKLKRKDGEILDGLVSLSPLDPDDFSKGFITTIVDITEKKKMENEINKIAKFPSENPNPIMRASFDGQLLYANKASSELLSFWKINIGDKLPNEILNEIKEVFSRNQKISKEILINNIYFLFDIVPIFNESYVNLYGKDITEERKAEKSLKESEEKFKKFFEKNPDYSFLTSPDGFFIDINESALNALGYEKNELIGKHRSILYPPESIQKMKEIFRKFEKFGYIEDEEITIVSKNGERRIILLSAVKINDEKGKWINSISVHRDITERKKAEEELIIYKNHLEELVDERTARLESINKELESFSYSVSHDLRAPLRAIDGFGQALVEEYADKLGEEGIHYVDRIRKATKKMGALIDDMLRLSRISRMPITKQKVNLSEIAKEILNELSKLDKERKIKIKVQEDINVIGDYNLLKIMLDNLLNNAWKFTSKTEEAIIEFGRIREKEKDIYYIKDNGVGFDSSYVDRLFTPFNRLHSEEEFPGTGIGLANVKRIINMHGGNVWAEGKVGQGATFYFTIK